MLTPADAVLGGLRPGGAQLQCADLDGQRHREGGDRRRRHDQHRHHLAPRLQVFVAERGTLDQSLLGMNFIGSLSGFDVRGDRMILRD